MEADVKIAVAQYFLFRESVLTAAPKMSMKRFGMLNKQVKSSPLPEIILPDGVMIQSLYKQFLKRMMVLDFTLT